MNGFEAVLVPEALKKMPLVFTVAVPETLAWPVTLVADAGVTMATKPKVIKASRAYIDLI